MTPSDLTKENEELKKELAALSQERDTYRTALEMALMGLKLHDDAPYQCESPEGASGSIQARRDIEKALDAYQKKEEKEGV